jgi:hypothetical protein
MGSSIYRKFFGVILLAIVLGIVAPEVAAKGPKSPELPPTISQYIKDSLEASETRIKDFFAAPLGKISVGGVAAYLGNKIPKRGLGVGFACVGLLIIFTEQGFNRRRKKVPREKEGVVSVKTDRDGIDISARGTPSYIFAVSGFVSLAGGITLIILNP